MKNLIKFCGFLLTEEREKKKTNQKTLAFPIQKDHATLQILKIPTAKPQNYPIKPTDRPEKYYYLLQQQQQHQQQ